MKRSEAVFFFTLVDFLIQVAFFALVMFAIVQIRESQRSQQERQAERAAQTVSQWTGFSTITELSDHLSRLAPPQDFRGWADFMSVLRAPKVDEAWKDIMKKCRDPSLARLCRDLLFATDDPELIRRFVAAVSQVGDAERLSTALRQYGSPPCLIEEQRKQKEPYAVASVRLTDDAVIIERRTPAFDLLARRLGPGDKDRYSLAEFRARFAPLRDGQLHPEYRNCRLFVEATENTDLKFARDALNSAFRWKR